ITGAGRHSARRREARGRRGHEEQDHAGQSRVGQLPYLAVMVGVGIALLIISQGVRLVGSGTWVFAGVLLIAAMARLVLPERRAGLLSSRGGLLDVGILGPLGHGLLLGPPGVPGPT